MGTGFKDSERKKRVRHAMWERQQGRCFYCEREVALEHAEFDHIVPVSKGGKNGQYNLVIACVACNRQKGNALWLVPVKVQFRADGHVATKRSAERWLNDFRTWLASRGESWDGRVVVESMEYRRKNTRRK